MSYTYASTTPVQPFWQRINRFFLLPFDRAVLLRIGGLSAGAVLSLALMFLGGLGILLVLLAAFALLVVGARYGFKIIERSAKGYLRPSDYPLSDEDLVNTYLPYKYVAITIAFGMLLGLLVALSGGNEFVTWVVWFALFVLLMPAVTMRLVITGSLRGALNPAELASLVRRIGKPYLALAVFVFVADLCRTYGMAMLAVAGGLGGAYAGMSQGVGFGLGIGGVLLVFLLSAGFWYFTYMICAMIGYTMYQYADKLDISVMGPGEKSLRSVATARTIDVKARTRDALIGQLVTSGDVKEAIDLLAHDLRERPNDLSLNARLHKLILAEGNKLRIADNTEKYLALLIKSENWREAVELYEDAVARSPDWVLRNTDNIVPLAQGALRIGKPQVAGALIKGFDKKYPNHPQVPRAYLVGAQLMAEWAGKPDEAHRILDHVLKKYAHSDVVAEASRYLEVLQRMQR